MYSELANHIDSSNDKLITWFRDPVERVISNHRFFVKRLQDDPSTHSHVHKQNIHRKNESLLDYAAMEENQNIISKYISDASFENFFFIGFLESFSEDLKKLGKMLAWDSPTTPHENSNQSFKSAIGHPSKEELDKVRQWNSRDIDLYERAKRYKTNKFQGN